MEIVLKVPVNGIRDYELKGRIRIKPEAEIALKSLQLETGLSICDIASQLITQAAACVTIKRGPTNE